MGNKLSRSSDASDKFGDRDDDHYSRPAKRRRYEENSPDSGLGPDINGLLLPEEPEELQRSLRIEVLKILHKESSRVRFNGIFNGIAAPAVKDVANTRARCRITISYQRNGESHILHCDSQICTIKTFKNPVGPSRMARVQLRPFHVPEDKILIERDDDSVFDLADSYEVMVELESAGDPNWPPLNLITADHDEDIFLGRFSEPRHWVLRTHVSDLFSRHCASSTLMLSKAPLSDLPTDYVVESDVRWITGFSQNVKKLAKDVLPSITVFDPNEESFPDLLGQLNGQHITEHLMNGYANGTPEDMDDELEGETTPSRSLRHRENKNYNLKVLSQKSQGKEPRKRRKLDKLTDARIFYHLPAEVISVNGFSCCICQAPNQSLPQLRIHVLSHPEYNFAFDFKPARGGCQIVISHREDVHGSPIRPQVYQLGRPLKALDLEKLLDGDDSWITSRYGPDNDISPQFATIKVPQKLTSRRKDKKVVVPNTKQPLFDPLSKAILQPGTEIQQPVADDTWLIQKHRDTVQDFFDVDEAEKEYIKEWDAYLIKKQINSDAFLPRAFLAFVKEKAAWLVASQARVEEFGKHLSVLVGRGSLDDQTINDAIARIAEARTQKVPQALPKESPKSSQYRSSKGCTVCGRPVRGPTLLLCGNKGNGVDACG
ncbi:putative zinc finger domain-containing protein [Phaeoacremonium minimum UCRPA7]|uniref:Putative zinc finger domain-containing protein n=1 Tax=Phaeoacremonium minimum (strain UCR-PA7) TaxID=1286976 RepID=R8BYA1_PHAM7|nr:putative zinc finger domain-containing protein [Phaeoacremonium minimum UCRPA7]EOO04317.1 putative zinc finger domain-containing protein [Phaeoacremonium minimum UCRPA7]